MTGKAVRILLCVLFTASLATNARGQSTEDSTIDRERSVADRYLSVLMRRPRPGVALDRVYGFHVQNKSLGELRERLMNPNVDDAGAGRFTWGLIELQRGNHADAARALASAESERPDDAACSFYLGRALLAVGSPDRAAEAMQRAIDKEPARPEALMMFTDLARLYTRDGQVDRALAVWEKLQAMFPGDTRVGGQIAKSLAEEGRFELARERFESLAESTRKPDEKVSFAVQAAEMQRKLGDLKSATAGLEKILSRLRPGSWLYNDVRGRIEAGFLETGDYDALAEYYQQKLESQPDDTALKTRLSAVLVTAGRLNEARPLFESIIQRAPDDTEARLGLIDVLVRQNDVAAATDQFEQLSKLDPGNPDHLMRWGQVILGDRDRPLDKRRSDAARVWNQLADLRDDDAVTLSQIADSMRGVEQTGDAIRLYQRAIELDPTSPQYREYLGEYLHSLNRLDEAIAVWKSIASEDRRDQESLVRLAEVFGLFNQDDLAMQTWKQASELDLTFAQRLRYASELEESEQYDESLEQLKIAADIAESREEREQLLQQRIATYKLAGTLDEQIALIAKQPSTADQLRELALMYAAADDLLNAEKSIAEALKQAPDSISILLTAGELAETENRIGDAADHFRKLAEVDASFRTSHLQRVASLEISLGRFDDALATCDAIIDFNPASIESFLFKARTAFGIARNEQAIVALRRALSIAPRDNQPRTMLASHLADQFRTDESIELYWKAFEYERTQQGKLDVIRSLGPLYDRQTRVDDLVERLKTISGRDGDSRATQLMVATAYESVGDFGAAINAVRQVLSEQPRDLGLLEIMVRLSEIAGEIEQAARFQTRVTDLAATPENRTKSILLQLEAGLIEAEQALSMQASLTKDPDQLAGLIRLMLRSSDQVTARSICREAIRSDESLWDVELILAQMIWRNRGSALWEFQRAELTGLLQSIRSRKLAADQPAPTFGLKSTSKQDNPAKDPGSPRFWTRDASQLAATVRGRNRIVFSGSVLGSISSPSTQLIQPKTFGQARAIASAMQLGLSVADQSGQKQARQLTENFIADFEIDDPAAVDDPQVLWERQMVNAFVDAMMPKKQTITRSGSGSISVSFSTSGDETQDDRKRKTDEVMWRLAEIGGGQGLYSLYSMLWSRLANKASGTKTVTPLDDRKIDLLRRLGERYQDQGFATVLVGSSGGTVETAFRTCLANEFALSGHDDLAEQFFLDDPESYSDYRDLRNAIIACCCLGQTERAKEYVPALLAAARRATPATRKPVSGATMMSLVRMNRAFWSVLDSSGEDYLAAEIAFWTHSLPSASTKASGLGDGLLRTKFPVRVTANFLNVRVPISERLMDPMLVQSLLMFGQPVGGSVPRSTKAGPLQVRLPDALIESLLEPTEGALEDETKTRMVAAAFAYWWDNRVAESFNVMSQLVEKYPSDHDLKIEFARVAAELGRTRLALDTLDSFTPLDSSRLVRKERAAMNLAMELGDVERGRMAAERLFGMRLTPKIQFALAEQLKSLGLSDMASAMLRRTQSSRNQDPTTQLEIARSLESSGDAETAAEVAFTLFKRLSRQTSKDKKLASYQSQAISILRSTGRLQDLIDQVKDRAESMPNADRPKQLLSVLSRAARTGSQTSGKDTMPAVRKIAEVNETTKLFMQANASQRTKDYAKAVEFTLKAFQNEPKLLRSHLNGICNHFRNASSEDKDLIYEQLASFPLPFVVMGDLLRMDTRPEVGEARRKFLERILTEIKTPQHLFEAVRYIPNERRQQLATYKASLLKHICVADAFRVDSPAWKLVAPDSKGWINGLLVDAVDILKTDKEAETKFRSAAKTALADETTKRGAQFMLALLDVVQKNDKDKALSVIGKSMQPKIGDDFQLSSTVDPHLLWQASQILESIGGIPKDRIIEICEESNRSIGRKFDPQPQSTIGGRLIDLYQKSDRKADARDELLKQSANLAEWNLKKFPSRYREFVEFKLGNWIASEFRESDAGIESVAVYVGTIDNADAIEPVNGFAPDGQEIQKIEAGLSESLELTTPQMAADYLLRTAQRWQDADDDREVELMEASLRSVPRFVAPSSLAFAIEKAQSGDARQRDSVEEFAQSVQILAGENEMSWRYAAVDVMLAGFRGDSDIEPKTDRLFERLPAMPNSTSENGGGESIELAQFLDLYPVALAASRSESSQAKSVANRLSAFMNQVLQRKGDLSSAMIVAGVSGDRSEFMSRILDQIESKAGTDKPMSVELAMQSLQIASDAAAASDLKTARRAFVLTYRHGAPLVKKANAMDPFLMSAGLVKPASKSSKQSPSKADLLEKRLDEFFGRLGSAIRRPLDRHDETKRAAMRDLTDACWGLFSPNGKSGRVFSLANSLADERPRIPEAAEPIRLRSISLVLAIAATASGEQDRIAAQIDQRLDASPQVVELAVAKIQLALACGDLDRLSRGLEQFSDLMKHRLPSLNETVENSPILNRSPGLQKRGLDRKIKAIDLVLHALWPGLVDDRFERAIDQDKAVSRSIAKSVDQLLLRTIHLIDSDRSTAYPYHERRVRLAEKQQALLKLASEHVDASR